MLTKEQAKICRKYSARDKDGLVHCKECDEDVEVIDFSEWRAKPKEEKVDDDEAVFED